MIEKNAPPPDNSATAYVDTQVREEDADRYFTAMFAPARQRPHLLALYAFNVELARVRETVSEPMMGEIRLQWWRDAVSAMGGGGDVPHQPVAECLQAAVVEGKVAKDDLLALIDARIPELTDEPPEDWEAFTARLSAVHGKLNEVAAGLLGAEDAERKAAVAAGLAYGLAQAMRQAPRYAALNRLQLPEDRVTALGVTLQQFYKKGGSEGQRTLMGEIHQGAKTEITRAHTLLGDAAPKAVSPFLLATIAGNDLKAMLRSNFEPTVDVRARRRLRRLLRLYWAGMRGRF